MQVTRETIFSVSDKQGTRVYYIHGLNPEDDSSYLQLLQFADTSTHLFRVSSGGALFEEGKRIGVFTTNNQGKWTYFPADSNLIFCANSENLLVTEVEFFKYLLKKRTQDGCAHCTY